MVRGDAGAAEAARYDVRGDTGAAEAARYDVRGDAGAAEAARYDNCETLHARKGERGSQYGSIARD